MKLYEHYDLEMYFPVSCKPNSTPFTQIDVSGKASYWCRVFFGFLLNLTLSSMKKQRKTSL